MVDLDIAFAVDVEHVEDLFSGNAECGERRDRLLAVLCERRCGAGDDSACFLIGLAIDATWDAGKNRVTFCNRGRGIAGHRDHVVGKDASGRGQDVATDRSFRRHVGFKVMEDAQRLNPSFLAIDGDDARLDAIVAPALCRDLGEPDARAFDRLILGFRFGFVLLTASALLLLSAHQGVKALRRGFFIQRGQRNDAVDRFVDAPRERFGRGDLAIDLGFENGRKRCVDKICRHHLALVELLGFRRWDDLLVHLRSSVQRKA